MKHIFGTPLWLMKEYLTELGALETEKNVLTAPDWRAVVCKSEPAQIGSFRLGRIEVELTGDEAAIEAMLEKLHLKTLRCGG